MKDVTDLETARERFRVPDYNGLHHHETEAEEEGYTFPEIVKFLKSSSRY